MASTTKSRNPTPETASWYQFAVNQRRQTLFAPGIIPLFGSTMLLVLWMALPSQDLAQRLARSNRSDLLTIAYLKAWLTAKPNDLPIYLTLARHNLLLGGYDEALSALRRLPKEAGVEIRREADQLRLVVLERKAYSLPEGSIERRALIAQVVDELTRLANTSQNIAELRELMVRAESLDNPKLAALVLRRVLSLGVEPGQTPWLKRVAELAIGWGEMALSLDVYWALFAQSRSPLEKRDLLIRIGQSMQALKRTVEFLDIADAKRPEVLADKVYYEFLIRQALAAGLLERAERYAHELLKFSFWREPADEFAPRAQRAENPFASNIIDLAMIVKVQYTPPAENQGSSPGTPADSSTPAPSNAPPAQRFNPNAVPRLPFDDSAYKLAYEVFLANSNQADAYKVAESAVQQVPTNLEWRKRLAQIAEWTQKPKIALVQWLYLAENGAGSDAWTQVRRLATGLSDFEVLLTLQKLDAKARPGDLKMDEQVVGALETLGRPLEARSWIEDRLQNQKDPVIRRGLIGMLLKLAERLEDEDLVVSTLTEIQKLDGPKPEIAVRIATSLYRHKNFTEAFAALQVARNAATPLASFGADREKALGYWALFAELAKRQQRDDDAWLAYQQLLVRELLTEELLENVAAYLDGYSTVAAAMVTEFSYRKFGKPAQLERLFSLYTELGDFAALQALLKRFTPEERRRFEKNPTLIRMRVQFYQSTRQFDLARKDLETLLTLDPESTDTKSAMIWLLLGQKDARALRSVLAAWAPIAERESSLWGPYGAAYMSLNEPARALPFFRRQARENPDYLWWLAYADVLAENGLQDAAWSLRRRAWTELRRGGAAKIAAQPEIRDRVVSLAMQFAPGDPAKAVLQSLINDRNLGAGARRRLNDEVPAANARLPKISGLAPGESFDQLPDVSQIRDGRDLLALLGPLLNRSNQLSMAKLEQTEREVVAEEPVEIAPSDAAAKELALSYFLSTENFDTARAWLLSRYADELSRPAWAELSLALSNKDQAKLVRLLDEMPDWLPKLEAVTAMQQTQRLASAQSLAYETLESRPFSHEAHQKLVETLLPDAPNVKGRYLSGYQGGLDFSTWSFDGSWRMPMSVMMTAVAEATELRTSDANLLGYVPGRDRTVGLNARGQRDHGWWQASLARREAVREFTNLRIDWQESFDVRLQSLTSLGLRQPALETPALRVGGMKDLIETRVNYKMSQREYFVGYVSLSRMLSQSGASIGTGRTFSLEAGHRLRIEYPDIVFRAGISASSFSSNQSANDDPVVRLVAPAGATDAIAAFIPQGSREFSVNASYGESARSTYTRALRPYGEVGIRQNSLTGLGFSLRSGLSTSVAGNDRFSLFLNAVTATPGNTRGLREVGMSYQWLY